MSKRGARAVAVINFPSFKPVSPVAPAPESAGMDVHGTTGDGLELDPAQQVLLELEEAKKRRKREETKIELEKIHDRIKYTLADYERPRGTLGEGGGADGEQDEVDFAMLEDPLELFELLSDPRMRTKYQQYVSVFIVGYEDKCEDREKLLQSLQDFFQETQAGNTQQVLDEVASEEVDFDQATLGLESALETAQLAANRLLEIKREMGQLFLIFATYPDTKKGRKKMEKSLLKAQEEVQRLTGTLESVQQELGQSKDKCQQLQRQLEAKNTENTKLRKNTEQVKKLELTNDSLKAELASMQSDLRNAQEELEKVRSVKVEPVIKEVLKVDEGRTRELEAQLAAERDERRRLDGEREEAERQLKEELEQVRVEHEGELQEMRTRYEEQLRSLMVDEEEEGEVGEDTTLPEPSKEDEVAAGGEGALTPPEEEPVCTESLGGEGGAKQLASGSYVQRVKLDHESKVKKLNEELNDVKNKSRKTITSLRAQLTDTQNCHTTELSSLRKELSNQTDRLQGLGEENSSLGEQIGSLKKEGARVREELDTIVAQRAELQAAVEQLRNKLQAVAGSPEQAVNVINHSAQWSEKSGPQTPRSLGASPPQGIPPFLHVMPPLIPMDEVLHDGTLLSMNTPLQQTPQYGSQISMDTGGGAGGFRMTSLEGSGVCFDAAPFGSPFQSGSGASTSHPLQQKHPLPTLPLLAQSRLSFQQHHTPSPQQLALTFSHPVVTEWTKAYGTVVRFRDNLVELLSENSRLAGLAEELSSVEVHTLDKTQDVQGQVTQMRFSLSLLLHQMEQTLQETLYLGEEGDGGEGKGEAPGTNELTDTLTQLQRKLRHSEETHKIELEESKETIANLSSKVESLKIEVAGLRRSLPEGIGDGSDATIMFTRLDSERNTRTLKTALENERISPTTYSKLTAGMQGYIGIPGKRLAHLSRRCHDRALAQSLIEQVHKSYRDPNVASQLVEDISSLDHRRHLEFSAEMERLSALRLDMAQSLTNTLTHVERTAGVFLIKPIYAPQRSRMQGGLITPIARPLPTRRPLATHPSCVSRPRTGSGGQSARSTPGPHPKMRLVSSLLHSQQGHRGEAREDLGATNISGRGTPQVQRMVGVAGLSGGEWNVAASRTPGVADPTFSLLSIPQPPSLPKMVELEVLRGRHPSSLLAHVLPSLNPPFPHSTPTHRLAPLVEHSRDASAVTSEISRQDSGERAAIQPASNATVITGTHPLPPILVPSRTDGPISVL